jgi:hypothetical protein
MTKKEAIQFLKKNPDKERYINENYRNFWNYEIDEADDDSIELGEEWEEAYEKAYYNVRPPLS